MLKEFIKRGLIGIGAGNLISLAILIIIAKCNKVVTITINEYVMNIIASSIIGFMFAGASVLFENEKISLLKATILHFVILTVTYYSMAFLAKWINFNGTEILISIVSFASSYTAIWFGIRFATISKLKKINKKLNVN